MSLFEKLKDALDKKDDLEKREIALAMAEEVQRNINHLTQEERRKIINLYQSLSHLGISIHVAPPEAGSKVEIIDARKQHREIEAEAKERDKKVQKAKIYLQEFREGNSVNFMNLCDLLKEISCFLDISEEEFRKIAEQYWTIRMKEEIETVRNNPDQDQFRMDLLNSLQNPEVRFGSRTFPMDITSFEKEIRDLLNNH